MRNTLDHLPLTPSQSSEDEPGKYAPERHELEKPLRVPFGLADIAIGDTQYGATTTDSSGGSFTGLARDDEATGDYWL